MDTLTHALSGVLVARATAPQSLSSGVLPIRRRIAIGFLAAAFPDLDIVSSFFSPLSYLYHHRGVTHSVIMLPVWAFVLATTFALIWRMRPGWRAYYGICFMAIAAHIAGDWITSFGTMLLAPFSDTRYALSTTFIIDLWFSGIIIAGLLASLAWRRSRAAAVAALVTLFAYVGAQWMLQQEAIDFGMKHAHSAAIANARVTAMPRPVSPFNWTVIVDDSVRFHYAHVNLIRKAPKPAAAADASLFERLDAAYRPLDRAIWLRAARFGTSPEEMRFAREAFSQPDFAFFRWFAAYPALLKIERVASERCAWFEDLRFVTPGRDVTPFQYSMCRRENRWTAYQLIGGGRVPLN